MLRRVVVVVLVAALGVSGCTGDTAAPQGATCAAHATHGSSPVINGSIRYVQTIGSLTDPNGPTWNDAAPRAGVVKVVGEGVNVSLKTRTGADGQFQCEVPAGRYQVSGFIPGVYEQDDSTLPIIVDTHTVTARQGEPSAVRLLVYQWLP
jgi:hypothetical protein